MKANSLLSIVIPTCNRAEFLDCCLDVHIPLARKFNISIFIFDNASIDGTRAVVEGKASSYPFLHYFRNEDNLGPDANIEAALKYPNTDYVWLLGDTYRIPDEGINYVINLISNVELKFDAIILNLADKIKDIQTQNFNDRNSLLRELGALMTCLSCLIFNRELINKDNFKKYHNSWYLQTGIIFEAISDCDFFIHWAQAISILGLKNRGIKKNSWSMTNDVFDIAGVKWINLIMSLPNSFDVQSKLVCIKKFTKVSGIFSPKHLLLLRSENILNNQIYNQYSYLLPLLMNFPARVIFGVVTLMPIFLLRLLVCLRCGKFKT